MSTSPVTVGVHVIHVQVLSQITCDVDTEVTKPLFHCTFLEQLTLLYQVFLKADNFTGVLLGIVSNK